MASYSRFLKSDGLIPTTLFDKGDTDMDVSEEMEEIRENLYELIKNNFPRGVASDHLAKKYHEEFVCAGLGRELPSNWLEQVRAADEFEAQARGPLTILFIRLASSASRQLQAPTPKIATAPFVSILRSSTHNSDKPLEHAQMLLCNMTDCVSWGERRSAIVVAYANASDFHLRLTEAQPLFELLKKEMKDAYESIPPLHPQEVFVGGAYAMRDSEGDWFRVLVQAVSTSANAECLVVDVGVVGSFPISSLRFLQPSSIQTASLATRVYLEDLPVDASNDCVDDSLRRILFSSSSDGQLLPLPLEVLCMSPGKAANGARGVRIKLEGGKGVSELLAEAVEARIKRSFDADADFHSQSVIMPMAAEDMPSLPFLAHPIYAAGPAEMSLRQASLDPMPDYMYSRLSEDCEDNASSLIESPEPGSFYALSVHGQWQRVLAVRASKIDPSSYLVYLIDIGAFQYTRPSALRRLNANSPFKKMLVFKCKLFGVVPTGGADVWNRDAQLAVEDFFKECGDTPVRVIPRGEWSNWKQLNAPALPVVEASVRFGTRDLSERLISLSLAHPSH